MSAEPARVQLEAVLDLSAAERLHARLSDLRGQAIEIDASAVDRLGGLCLQVLLSARATWTADRCDAALVRPSDAFQASWELFGAPRFNQHEFNPQGPDA